MLRNIILIASLAAALAACGESAVAPAAEATTAEVVESVGPTPCATLPEAEVPAESALQQVIGNENFMITATPGTVTCREDGNNMQCAAIGPAIVRNQVASVVGWQIEAGQTASITIDMDDQVGVGTCTVGG